MVRPEMEYKIGDEVICPAGQLLTLTSAGGRTAGRRGRRRQRPLLSQRHRRRPGRAAASRSGLPDADGRHVRASRRPRRIARVHREASRLGHSAGPGPAGPLHRVQDARLRRARASPGILLLAVWFWGHHVAGLAGMGEMLLFAARASSCCCVEIFVIPGFGIAGVAGHRADGRRPC